MPPKVRLEDERPAAKGSGVCFYCHRAIGDRHDATCVLWTHRVKVRVTIDYEVDVPYSWTKEIVEFHRNEGSWCASNVLNELENVEEEIGCLCPASKFEYLGEVS